MKLLAVYIYYNAIIDIMVLENIKHLLNTLNEIH